MTQVQDYWETSADYWKALAAAQAKRTAKSHRSDGRWKLGMSAGCLSPTLSYYTTVHQRSGYGLRSTTLEYWDRVFVHPEGIFVGSLQALLGLAFPVVAFALFVSARTSYKMASAQEYHAETLSGVRHRSWLAVAGIIFAALLAPTCAIIAALLNKGYIDPIAAWTLTEQTVQTMLRSWW